jgi:hypothetical protein
MSNTAFASAIKNAPRTLPAASPVIPSTMFFIIEKQIPVAHKTPKGSLVFFDEMSAVASKPARQGIINHVNGK